MSKKIIFTSLLLLTVLVITGCSKQETQQTNNSDQSNKKQVVQDNSWQERFAESSLEEVIVGNFISVTGTTNSDGSILAETIVISPSQEGLGEARKDLEGQNMVGNQADQAAPEEMLDNMSDFAEFKNMSDEQKQAMREQKQARENMPSVLRNKMGAAGGQMRLIGEVIGIDVSTITVKNQDGGSKIVFYSTETKYLKPNNQD